MRVSRMFSKGVSRHVSVTRASRFVHCRSAQQGKQYALLLTLSNQAQPMRMNLAFPSISTITHTAGGKITPKSAIFMPQTTEISPKCAPENSMFASKQASIPTSRPHQLRAWPKPSRFLVKSLPFVDRGAILAPITAASPHPQTSINARNNDEWNPAPGL